MSIIAGLLIDRWGVKMVYGVATAWWSVAAALHALASSALGFGIFRFLLGTAESANFVGAQKVAAEWFPPKDRGTLNGLVQAGTVTAALITPPLVVWLSLQHGWRAAFVWTGATGLLWVLAWFAYYDFPERHRCISAEELRLIRSERDNEKASIETTAGRWLDFFRFPQVWALLIARIVSDPVWWFYLFWLPKYLTESRGLSMQEMGMVVWIPYLASDLGSVIGGWYSGHLISQGRHVVASRKVVMLFAAMLMPVGI